MRKYYIVRTGSNSANQHMQQWALLETVEGKLEAEKMLKDIQDNQTHHTVYANQWVGIWTAKECKRCGINISEEEYA